MQRQMQTAVQVPSASTLVSLELYGAWERAPSIFETLQKHSLNSNNAGVKKKIDCLRQEASQPTTAKNTDSFLLAGISWTGWFRVALKS